MSRSGGLSETSDATAEIKAIAEEVKGAAEAKAGQCFSKFVATKYRSQVVAGTNYFIKVDVGDGQYVHIRVFQSLPTPEQKVELTDIQTGHTADDEITYF
ncbi:stefin-C-like [Oscarella lobularis]|uniref:stefin-C-like n=1 Tax=Oscarella lobularis TaxID=121494 RepID=UPI003314089A